jgi:hypothetical protein
VGRLRRRGRFVDGLVLFGCSMHRFRCDVWGRRGASRLGCPNAPTQLDPYSLTTRNRCQRSGTLKGAFIPIVAMTRGFVNVGPKLDGLRRSNP